MHGVRGARGHLGRARARARARARGKARVRGRVRARARARSRVRVRARGDVVVLGGVDLREAVAVLAEGALEDDAAHGGG